MSKTKSDFIDRVLDGIWDGFEAATEWLKQVVDTQPWTHFFLGISLCFVIVWLKNHNIIFHLAWIPLAWYWLVIIGAPIRIGSKY